MKQSEVIERLATGEAFDVPPRQRIDTHISVIFLTATKAYKLKRADRTSYLDYRTLDARKRGCEREIQLNTRTAPAIYLRAVPVTLGATDRLEIDGDGEPVEWLVEMRRFDPDETFDILARDNRLSRSMLIETASQIARLHRSAPVISDAEFPHTVRKIIDGDRTELLAADGRVFGPEADELIKRLTDRHTALCTTHMEAMKYRADQGYVRDCHGDLHLGNICLYEGKPTIFDAIEFNDAFNHIDVLYDLAFMLMDLAERGDTPAANIVLNRYLHDTGEYSGLRLLPLFQSVRATIRAHVSAKAAHEQPETALREKSAAAARAYLRFADNLLEEAPACVIAIGGYSGTGKTTIANRLAPLVGAPPGAAVLSSDLLRKRRFAVALTARLDETAYSEAISQEVYDEMFAAARQVLREGMSVICDATFITPDQREGIERLYRDLNVPFRGYWLTGDEGILSKRIDERRGDASDATPDVLRKQLLSGPGAHQWKEVSVTDTAQDAFEAIRSTV